MNQKVESTVNQVCTNTYYFAMDMYWMWPWPIPTDFIAPSHG